MTTLTLAQVRAIADAVLLQAEGEGLKLAFCILDPAGWPQLQMRMDGAFLAASDAAFAKARTAALYRRPSSDFSQRFEDKAALAFLPHVVPLGGGVLLERNGEIIGVLGISGANEEAETRLAQHIAAAFAAGAIAGAQ